MWWLILHVPFVVFLRDADRSLVTLLTIAQGTTITALASFWARKWRTYEAIAFTAATILATGIVSVVCLFLLGYRLPFESQPSSSIGRTSLSHSNSGQWIWWSSMNRRATSSASLLVFVSTIA